MGLGGSLEFALMANSGIIQQALEGLTDADLAAQPNDQSNSIGWLLWHQARVEDALISGLTGKPQAWVEGKWHERFGMDADPSNIGTGHNLEQVAGVKPTLKDLKGYSEAVRPNTLAYLGGLNPADLDQEVDTILGDKRRLGDYVGGFFLDTLHHGGQVCYLRGYFKGWGWFPGGASGRTRCFFGSRPITSTAIPRTQQQGRTPDSTGPSKRFKLHKRQPSFKGGKTMTEVKQVDMEQEISDLEKEIAEKRERLNDLRKNIPATEVKDYTFKAPGGKEITLSGLFGEKDELILIHNMGKSCPYCTLWADGLVGVRKHLEDRAAFVVVSPDDPAAQQEFAAGRGWNFKMYSSQGSSFTKDVGYQTDEGGYIPGVSVFRKNGDGKIARVSNAFFGPGDLFCSVWHLFDLLPGGPGDWQPKYSY
jgi:predicted dithiol-disulfide oxidoreductase (DUF899 family)/uncharacterized damage-inducible protein DinB